MDQNIQPISDLELPPTTEEKKHWAAVDCVFEIILKVEHFRVWAITISEEYNQLSLVNPYLSWDAIQRSKHLEREKILDRMDYSKLIQKIEKALPEIYNKESGGN